MQSIIYIIKNYEKSKNIASINNKKFIFTCHIKRNFKKEKRNRLFTVSLISDINQKFIDNLNDSKKTLKKIINDNNILDILNDLKLEEITFKYFKFLNNSENNLCEITDNINGINDENYIDNIYHWIKEEKKYGIKKIIKTILPQINKKDTKIKEYLVKDIFLKDKIEKKRC